MTKNIENYEIDKKEFFKLYEDVMNDRIDLNALSTDKLKKIRDLLKEEIIIKERYVERLKGKLNDC